MRKIIEFCAAGWWIIDGDASLLFDSLISMKRRGGSLWDAGEGRCGRLYRSYICHCPHGAGIIVDSALFYAKARCDLKLTMG